MNGTTFEPTLDFNRLSTQLEKVKTLMLDGEWRTLGEIKEAIEVGSEASISARLRDLRNKQGFTVLRSRRGDPKMGLFEYCVKDANYVKSVKS